MPSRRQVINIRGANASGKTTQARYFHDAGSEFELGRFPDADKKITSVKAYRKELPGLALPVYLVGTYDDSKYSGMDKVKSADVICAAVSHAANVLDGHVVFEGFRVSKSWERFASLRNLLVHEVPIEWLWVIMHAPIGLILERATARREAGSKPADAKELGAVVRQMDNTRVKALSAFPGDVLQLDPRLDPGVLHGQLKIRLALRESR